MPEEKDISCQNICSKREVPDKKELEALDALRAIKARVRAIKEELNAARSSKGGTESRKVQALEQELTRLKNAWSTWSRKREEAARERMIILGHEQPPREI